MTALHIAAELFFVAVGVFAAITIWVSLRRAQPALSTVNWIAAGMGALLIAFWAVVAALLLELFSR